MRISSAINLDQKKTTHNIFKILLTVRQPEQTYCPNRKTFFVPFPWLFSKTINSERLLNDIWSSIQSSIQYHRYHCFENPARLPQIRVQESTSRTTRFKTSMNFFTENPDFSQNNRFDLHFPSPYETSSVRLWAVSNGFVSNGFVCKANK